MPIVEFPPIETADDNGLLAVGGDFHPNSLLLAYTQAIFPWPIGPEYPLAWFSPDPRGVIQTNDIHIPRSFKKDYKRLNYHIRYNTNFEAVIRNCKTVVRKGESDTWITEDLIQGYLNFHRLGHAYSVEVYNSEDNLVGGVYGVNIGRFISGESMFFTESNASKFALINLVQNLNKQKIKYLDTQMVTKATEKLGALEIKRSEFKKYVQETISGPAIDFSLFSKEIEL